MSFSDVKRMYGVATTYVNSAAALTDSILVSANGNQRIVVDFLEISTDGIITAVLNSKGVGAGTQISCKEYMAANSGKVLDTPFLMTNNGESLSITTTIATTANYSVYVAYHYQ